MSFLSLTTTHVFLAEPNTSVFPSLTLLCDIFKSWSAMGKREAYFCPLHHWYYHLWKLLPVSLYKWGGEKKITNKKKQNGQKIDKCIQSYLYNYLLCLRQHRLWSQADNLVMVGVIWDASFSVECWGPAIYSFRTDLFWILERFIL